MLVARVKSDREIPSFRDHVFSVENPHRRVDPGWSVVEVRRSVDGAGGAQFLLPVSSALADRGVVAEKMEKLAIQEALCALVQGDAPVQVRSGT